ncbi:hypothetical protein QYE76_033577 [Lolium multiflorum]|uniref:Transposase n=1 Tax=Lolium multiflorum TaxID=4521 RepID=A0AAD8VKF1_LOLMU|nr:hypothetical protein QYE76_033577 [Lolium multiflorum]
MCSSMARSGGATLAKSARLFPKASAVAASARSGLPAKVSHAGIQQAMRHLIAKPSTAGDSLPQAHGKESCRTAKPPLRTAKPSRTAKLSAVRRRTAKNAPHGKERDKARSSPPFLSSTRTELAAPPLSSPHRAGLFCAAAPPPPRLPAAAALPLPRPPDRPPAAAHQPRPHAALSPAGRGRPAPLPLAAAARRPPSRPPAAPPGRPAAAAATTSCRLVKAAGLTTWPALLPAACRPRPGDAETSEDPEENTKEYYEALFASQKPLHENTEVTQLDAIARLMALKCHRNLCRDGFDELLVIVGSLLPKGHLLPQNFYYSTKLLSDLKMSSQQIHACPKGCMLFREEHADTNYCIKCNSSRYFEVDRNGDGQKRQTTVAKNILRYLPVLPRIQRLFMTEDTAQQMRWAVEGNRYTDKMIHPSDGTAWKNFVKKFPLKAGDPRSVAVAISTDGFNPYGMSAAVYSCWPVFVIPMNLPPGVCMRSENMFVSMIIPGPKYPGKNMNVYLEPLVDDLVRGWEGRGIRTYDASKKEYFDMYVWYHTSLHDLPARALFCGWCTHGKWPCPQCRQAVTFFWLNKGGKYSCFDEARQFLERRHAYRSDVKSFKKGRVVRGPKPIPKTGTEIKAELDALKPSPDGNGFLGYGETHQWTHKPCLWKLPYFEFLELPHNIDVMHTEKNISEAIWSTIVDTEKTKDNIKARIDQEMWPFKYSIPYACRNPTKRLHGWDVVMTVPSRNRPPPPNKDDYRRVDPSAKSVEFYQEEGLPGHFTIALPTIDDMVVDDEQEDAGMDGDNAEDEAEDVCAPEDLSLLEAFRAGIDLDVDGPPPGFIDDYWFAEPDDDDETRADDDDEEEDQEHHGGGEEGGGEDQEHHGGGEEGGGEDQEEEVAGEDQEEEGDEEDLSEDEGWAGNLVFDPDQSLDWVEPPDYQYVPAVERLRPRDRKPYRRGITQLPSLKSWQYRHVVLVPYGRSSFTYEDPSQRPPRGLEVGALRLAEDPMGRGTAADLVVAKSGNTSRGPRARSVRAMMSYTSLQGRG